jgi:hypothetical protein
MNNWIEPRAMSATPQSAARSPAAMNARDAIALV